MSDIPAIDPLANLAEETTLDYMAENTAGVAFRARVNASTFEEAQTRFFPLLNHFFEGDLAGLDITFEVEPLMTPDATIRSFIVDCTALRGR